MFQSDRGDFSFNGQLIVEDKDTETTRNVRKRSPKETGDLNCH
jgi:hypothetical protein